MSDAREIIARALLKHCDWERHEAANLVLAHLIAAGYRILGPDEVQAIRDEALEEAATLADWAKASREQLYAENNASINAHKAVQSEELAAAIRSLKGGRNA